MSSTLNHQAAPASQKDGLLLLDKVAGITSHDAVERARRVTRIKKIGHSGTLDPMATGLLILCVGKATRLQAFLMKMEKTYEGTIQFGWATNTYDAQGEQVGDRTEVDLSSFDLEGSIGEFQGEIQQIPPAFSAKKVQGVRSYELARRGAATTLEAKTVRIVEFRILRQSGSRADFRITCTSGTYVRSVAHDLGRVLGVGAHLSSLRRTAIGGFEVAQALSVDQLSQMDPREVLEGPHFQTMNRAGLPFQRIMIDRSQEAKLLRGQSVIVKPSGDSPSVGELISVVNVDQELLAISEVVDVLRADGGPVVLQPKVVLRGE